MNIEIAKKFCNIMDSSKSTFYPRRGQDECSGRERINEKVW